MPAGPTCLLTKVNNLFNKRSSVFPRCIEYQCGLAMRKVSACLSIRVSVRLYVRLSVCLCVKRVDCDKTEEWSVQIYIIERTFSLVFWKEKWLVWATTATWNFGSTGPSWSKIADFRPTFTRSASAVTSSEKSSINTNRTSITRFQMSHHTLLLSTSKGTRKRKTAVFFLKLLVAWRKSATKFLCVKTVSGKVVRHSLA